LSNCVSDYGIVSGSTTMNTTTNTTQPTTNTPGGKL